MAGLFGDEQAIGGTIIFSATSEHYKDLVYAPGTYRVTITGTASRLTDQLIKTATFDLTLVDPCDPPTSLTKPAFDNYMYTIADNNANPYTYPVFVVSPDYCTITYNYATSTLTNGGSAIT